MTFVEKPFKADRLLHVAERALEAARLKREVQELKLKAGDEGELVGNSPNITQLRVLIDKIAPTNSRVLIAGPAGSGKEVAARLIHARSRRAGNAFVAINCATMEPDRLEAELFGVESTEGPRKTGLFELAHNGTLYLDEVADMPLETQGKILRVLIDQTFTRVGGQSRVQVDARVICSTTSDLRPPTSAPAGSSSSFAAIAPSCAVTDRASRSSCDVSGSVCVVNWSIPGCALPTTASSLARVALALFTVVRRSAISGPASREMTVSASPLSLVNAAAAAVACLSVARVSTSVAAISGPRSARLPVSRSALPRMLPSDLRFAGLSSSFNDAVSAETLLSSSGALASNCPSAPARGGITGRPNGPISVIGGAPPIAPVN